MEDVPLDASVILSTHKRNDKESSNEIRFLKIYPFRLAWKYKILKLLKGINNHTEIIHLLDWKGERYVAGSSQQKV